MPLCASRINGTLRGLTSHNWPFTWLTESWVPQLALTWFRQTLDAYSTTNSPYVTLPNLIYVLCPLCYALDMLLKAQTFSDPPTDQNSQCSRHTLIPFPGQWGGGTRHQSETNRQHGIIHEMFADRKASFSIRSSGRPAKTGELMPERQVSVCLVWSKWHFNPFNHFP